MTWRIDESKVTNILKAGGHNYLDLAANTGYRLNTLLEMCSGEPVEPEAAYRIAKELGVEIEDILLEVI